MYILTQDKNNIVDTTGSISIYVTDLGYINIVYTEDYYITLGEYESVSRAREVLDDIFNAIIRFENINILQGCNEEVITGLTILAKEHISYNRYFMPEE